VQKLSKDSINSPLSAPPFIKGQLWQLIDTTRFIQIGHVGKLLVHHRTIVPSLKRSLSRQTLSSIKDLQTMLTANKAVLVESCS
jgi:hypothetical protein